MPTAARIADRLRRVRRDTVVGRSAEIAAFRDALTVPESPFIVLSFQGPGGIGKTTLLNTLRDVCAEQGIPTARFEGRSIDPTAPGFRHAWDTACATLSLDASRAVLFLDTWEALEPLEGLLRDELIPALPEGTLVVLAGRNPLSQRWRTDPAWWGLLQTKALPNLSSEESREMLRGRGVPEERHPDVLAFAQGYPLALALASEWMLQERENPSLSPQWTLTDEPDLMRALIERFLDSAPGPLHRAALEACALLRVTTEAALTAILEVPSDGQQLFDWLCSLSFVETFSPGISPHAVARDALIADLRWRNPDQYAYLHRRANAYYAQRLAQPDLPEREQQRLLWDYIYLHRENAVVRSAFTWQDTLGAYPDRPVPKDYPILREAVVRHEGQESARLFDYWWERGAAAATIVFRSGNSDQQGKSVVGFLTTITLEQTDAADGLRDPAVAAARRWLAEYPALLPTETATLFRWWMALDTYHAVSPVQSLIVVSTVRHYLTTQGLAYSLFPVVRPDAWAHAFAYAGMRREQDADFTVGERTYGVFAYDWRALPPTRWLTAMVEKELAGVATAPSSAVGTLSVARPPISIPPGRGSTLDHDAFAAAVKEALRHLTRTEALLDNPLLSTRLLAEQASAGVANGGGPARSAASALGRAALLQSLLRETIAGLEASPREARAYRALYHTFLRPAPTQEQAAERLDLPFSTYRRHLAEGIALVTESLWRQECDAATK